MYLLGGTVSGSCGWHSAGTKCNVSSAGALPLGSRPLELKCILFWHSVQLIRNLVTASLGRNAYVSAIWGNNRELYVLGEGEWGGKHREHRHNSQPHIVPSSPKSLPSPKSPPEQLLVGEHFGRVTGVSLRHRDTNEQTFGIPEYPLPS